VKWFFGLLLAAALGLAGWIFLMLHWSYSQGDRAGYVQKLSKKGWICKTWEGELALITMPGTVAEKFYFTVRDDATAAEINSTLGNRVTLYYEQHIGLPTSCWGETQYFIKKVTKLADVPVLH